MARKGAQRSDPGRRPGSPVAAPGTRRAPAALERGYALALALALVLSLAILWVHEQLTATHGAYASFCNVGTRVNCDVVLSSAYGMLLGLPVVVWALLTYLVLSALLVVRVRTSGLARGRATAGLLGLSIWSLAFSLYMAALAAFEIGAVCLLCSGLYLLNGILAVLAWRIVRAETEPGTPTVTARQLAGGAALLTTALALLGAAQHRSHATSHDLTPSDVETKNPDFYKWYTGLPLAEGIPPAQHVRGPADAAITVVEFSDFECNFCGKAFRDLRDVEAQHEGLIRVEFHHFPLDTSCNTHVTTTVHTFACDAAVAAECAARFGRFWEYHDRLFAGQDRLARAQLIDTAADLGIERGAFTACLDDATARERVVADTAEGARLGVKSTPTMFINRRPVEGALDRSLYDYVVALEHHG
ncbi:MAG TPA: thioredoxin domain-containing protein [Candidatus Binatia bacterium]